MDPSIIDRLADAKRASEAGDVDALRRAALAALESDSSDAIAYLDLATLLSEHRLSNEAALLLCRCVRLDPTQPQVLLALGILLVQSDQFEAAESTLSLAVQLAPDLADAWSMRAHCLAQRQHFDAAIESFERCLELRSLSSKELNNLAISLRSLGRLEHALARHNQAIHQTQDDPCLHLDRALTLLTQELSSEAWLGHEARFDVWETKGLSVLQASPLGERWYGQGPWPQQLLVVGEQGLGDVLQFVRYVPLLLERVRLVQLCVPQKLIGLLRGSLPNTIDLLAPEELASQPAVPWLALLSLPWLLEITETNSVPQSPYLRVSLERIEAWRARLCSEDELLIGVHWQGNPQSENFSRHGRSLPLEQLAPLAALPGVRLLSLQRGAGAEQLDSCSFRSSFVADQDDISTVLDFEDTAAMVACCDVVVSSDSALAHLAGGLGVPTHLLLHPFPDWRWGLEGENCHWYPSLRLHRQGLGESWRSVVLRLATELARQYVPQLDHQ
jgi:Flp pilus assembly protein TadD